MNKKDKPKNLNKIVIVVIFIIDRCVFFSTAVSRGLSDFKQHSWGYLSWRRPIMVHERMPEQLWMASTNRPGAIYHILFPVNGYSSMDCQFWNIPSEVSRRMWRHSSHNQLDIKPYCGAIFPVLNTSNWDIMDVPYIRSNLCCSVIVCPRMCAWNQGSSNRRNRENVKRRALQLEFWKKPDEPKKYQNVWSDQPIRFFSSIMHLRFITGTRDIVKQLQLFNELLHVIWI